MTTMTTQNSGARSVASVKMGNPSLVFGRCIFAAIWAVPFDACVTMKNLGYNWPMTLEIARSVAPWPSHDVAASRALAQASQDVVSPRGRWAERSLDLVAITG